MTEETAAAVKSPLEKPLNQLTEDDITQLTREDCRRYLKEKGMRRPSWNKSQAIQQVIMLKTLLETTPDDDRDSRKRLRISCPNINVNAASVPRGTSGDAENSLSAEETAPHCRQDLNKPDASDVLSGHFDAAADNESAQPRTPSSTNVPVGQMTIFYCGKVNVYDDVPADKARALMHIAASPLDFPQEQLVDGSRIVQPLPGSKVSSNKACPDSTVVFLPSQQKAKMMDNSQFLGEESNLIREETPVESPSTRKASVQRYLEKKKDRFKSKRKEGTTSCSSLDIHFNNQMSNQMLRSGTCSPPQIKPPPTPTRCSSVDNDTVQNVFVSTGLNYKGL